MKHPCATARRRKQRRDTYLRFCRHWHGRRPQRALIARLEGSPYAQDYVEDGAPREAWWEWRLREEELGGLGAIELDGLERMLRRRMLPRVVTAALTLSKVRISRYGEAIDRRRDRRIDRWVRGGSYEWRLHEQARKRALNQRPEPRLYPVPRTPLVSVSQCTIYAVPPFPMTSCVS